MRKYLLLLLVLFSAIAANSQVMDPADPVVNYNSGAVLGTAANPNQPAAGQIGKWVRTRNTSRIPWDETSWKCYIYGSMAYRIRWPQNYDPTKKYPVVLFFHGGGEAHEIHENEDQLFWGAKMFQDMIVANQFNAFLFFPQQDHVGWDDSYYSRINDVLDNLATYNGADPDRLITMGLSEGGLAAAAMASIYPKRVSTAIPSSPIDITTVGNMLNYIHVPVWIGSGGADTNPNAQVANSYADQFHGMGGDIYQTYYSTAGHVMWNTHWGMLDINNNSILAQWWNASHKAQPLVYYQNTGFCVGQPISARLGITAGFNAYQWQRAADGINFSDIPGATANEYTATQTGSYRVHFQRTSVSGWSDWTPKPIKIYTKPCSIDTLFAEHFERDDDYQYNAPSTVYKRFNFDCENGIFLTGTEFFTADATGRQGGRFSANYTNSSGCTYTTSSRVWGMYNNQPTVKPNTNYLFSFYAGNQNTSSLASLVPNINGAVPTLISKPTVLPAGVGANKSWTKFTYLWNSGFATSADIYITNNNINTSGNDFGLDEISFTRQLAPGGINSNMALWLKADAVPQADSERINDWANATGATPLTQLFQGNKPLLKNNATDNINFNPLVSFSTVNDQYMLGTSGYAGTGTYSAAHVFIVGRTPNNTQNDSVLIERQASSGRVAVSLPNGGNVVWDAGASSGGSHMTTPFLAGDVNKTLLWSFSKDNVNNTGSGNKQDIRKNGVVITSSNTTTPSFTGNNSNFKIGSSEERIAEVVYYLGANINSVSQNRIESYLAIKYGLTLGTTAAPVSYTASDGTTVFWPGSAIYQNDVFGIGLDSLSGLRQLKSNSVNSGSGDGTGQAGKANLILTATSTLGDKDFLMIGNDAGALAEHIIVAGEAPAGVQNDKRVAREWRVENTGNVGVVTLTFDTTGLTLAGGSLLSNYALLIDNDGDGDFNTGTPSVFHATSAAGKQINFSGVTLNDNTVFTIITQINTSLPATWLGFTAEGVNGNALLNWKTSEEVNVDYYAVEHSTNGRDFTVLGVKPANNYLGVNDYTYTHQSLSAGTHYYRIRRVDRDGVFKYSDVKTVKVSGVNAVQVRPNPVGGSTLTLALTMQQKAQTAIQVVTLDGKILSKTNTQLLQGLNTVNINVDAIPTGIYLVQIMLNDEVVTKKFVRTR